MRRFRVGSSVAVAALFVASVMLAQGARVSAAPTRAGTVSLATWSSNPTEQAGQKKLVAAFESKYHINVDFQVINGDYNAQLKTRITSGTAPDVFYINSDHIIDFMQAGSLKDLDFLKSDKTFGFNNFYKNLQYGYKYKGKTYAFVKDYSTLAMWYNKDMFKAAHISKPPTTWAQLQTDACKLTNRSNGVYGAVLSTGNADRWMAFLYAAGGALLGKGNKVVINSPAAKQALDFYAGLVKKGCAASPPSKVGAGWNGEAFGRGKAAIVFEGNWLTSAMQQTYPDIHWGVAPMPKGPKGYGNIAFTAAYGMWNKTPHLKDATTLIKYLAGKSGTATWTHEVQYLPARKDVKPPDPSIDKVFSSQVKYSHDWFWPSGFQDRALTPIGNDIQNVMDGKMSSSAALKDMDSAAKKALSGAP